MFVGGNDVRVFYRKDVFTVGGLDAKMAVIHPLEMTAETRRTVPRQRKRRHMKGSDTNSMVKGATHEMTAASANAATGPQL